MPDGILAERRGFLMENGKPTSFKFIEDIMEEIKTLSDEDVDKAGNALDIPPGKGRWEGLGVLSPALILLLALIERLKTELAEEKLRVGAEISHNPRVLFSSDAASLATKIGNLEGKIVSYHQFFSAAVRAEFDLFDADEVYIVPGWTVMAPPKAPCGHRHAPKQSKAPDLSSLFGGGLPPGMRIVEI